MTSKPTAQKRQAKPTPVLSAILPNIKNPKGPKQVSVLKKKIRELQQKIQELKLLKAQSKSKRRVQNVRYVDVPMERIVETQVIQYVDRIVQKQEVVIEYEPVEKIVEVMKQIPREVWTQRVIVRPPEPPEVIIVEVPVVKEILQYVEEQFDQRLYDEVEQQRLHCQELQLQLQSNLRTIERLKQELTDGCYSGCL